MIYAQAATLCILAISLSKSDGQAPASLRDIDKRRLMSRQRNDVPITTSPRDFFRHESDTTVELNAEKITVEEPGENTVDEANDARAEGRHQNKAKGDVDLKLNIGESAELRHSFGMDELNQKNPEGCTVDIDGNYLFADYEKATEMKLGFFYEIVVTRGVSNQQLERDILPLLERKLSNTVLANAFTDSCLGVRLRRLLESRKLEVVGLKTAPPDAVLDGETCASSVVTSQNQCRKIEGGIVIYSDSISDQDDIAMLKLVDDAMASGSLVDVSDKIVSVTYLERIVTPGTNETNDAQRPLSSSGVGVPAWGWALLGIGAVSILVAMALLYRLRYQEDSEFEDNGQPFIEENNYEGEQSPYVDLEPEQSPYADFEPAQTYDQGPPQFDRGAPTQSYDPNYDDTYDQGQPAQAYDQNYDDQGQPAQAYDQNYDDQGQPAQSYDPNFDEEPLNANGTSSDDYVAPRTTRKKKKSANREYNEDYLQYEGDGQGYDRPMFQA